MFTLPNLRLDGFLVCGQQHAQVSLEKGGRVDHWVMKRGETVLWRGVTAGQAFGGFNGLTAFVTPGRLQIVNDAGKVVFYTDLVDFYDPRRILRTDSPTGSYLVYSTGTLPMARQPEGQLTKAKWNEELVNRIVHVFDFKTQKPLWSEYEGLMGYLLSGDNGNISLLRITNTSYGIGLQAIVKLVCFC